MVVDGRDLHQKKAIGILARWVLGFSFKQVVYYIGRGCQQS